MNGKFSPFVIKALVDTIAGGAGNDNSPAIGIYRSGPILGDLMSVAKGIGALRTHGGDTHGREKGFRRIDPRIARLAINASSSLALFLIETWERQEKRALPQHMQDI